jgi:hypothetical protein
MYNGGEHTEIDWIGVAWAEKHSRCLARDIPKDEGKWDIATRSATRSRVLFKQKEGINYRDLEEN